MNKKRLTPKGGTFCYYANKGIVVFQGSEDKLLYKHKGNLFSSIICTGCRRRTRNKNGQY